MNVSMIEVIIALYQGWADERREGLEKKKGALQRKARKGILGFFSRVRLWWVEAEIENISSIGRG